MSETSKQVNRYFDSASKQDINYLLDNLFINEHLRKVFEMKYLQEYDVNYIADELGYSKSKIESDLRKIRKKICKLI